MAEEKAKTGGAHVDRVELELFARPVSKTQVAGIRDILALLTTVERKIQRINAMPLTPMMAGASQARAIQSMVAAQNNLNAAMARGNQIASQGAARTKLTTIHGSGKDAADARFLEQTFRTGPGQSRTTTTDLQRKAITKTVDVNNLEKAQQDYQKALDKYNKTQATIAKNSQRVEERRRAEESAAGKTSTQFQSRVQRNSQRIEERRLAEDAARLAKAEKADVLQRKTQARIQKNSQRAEEALRQQAATEIRATQFEQTLNNLRTAGYSRVRGTTTRDARTGASTQSDVFERFNAGRVERATLSRTLGAGGEAQRGRLTMGDSAISSRDNRNFLGNLQHITAWASGVAVLYGAINLARNSLGALITVGAQTARLEQVFQGVGGSAQQLTRDVLGLAAANGRSSEEAMQSAVQWSRMGLNRVQVNEAVRVSLMAANVAEITAADATERLASLMVTYQLRVGELNGVLGMLNQTSNTYNVTNKDLFDGIARVSGIAKQANIPLAELVGFIGAGVGATGQSGANIGNMLKATLGSLSTEGKQEALRSKFGFEVSTGGGEEMKDASQTIAELFVKYQDLNDVMRQNLVYTLVGKFQAARLTALLDHYVRSQVLAVNALTNLNSAEEENAKIKASLKSQLQGLVTEWQRFAVIQGNAGPAQMLGSFTESLRNLLALLNSPGMSMLTTGLIGIMTAIGLRTAMAASTMRAAGGNAGFLVNSAAGIRAAVVGATTAAGGVATGYASAGLPPGWHGSGTRGVVGSLYNWGSQKEVQRQVPGGGRAPWFEYKAYDKGGALKSGVLPISPRTPNAAMAGNLLQSQGMFPIHVQQMEKMVTVTQKLTGAQLALRTAARAAAVSIASLAQLAGPMIVIGLAIGAINAMGRAGRAKSDASDRRIAGFNDEAESAGKSAQASSLAMRLFGTVSKALPNARPDAALKMVDEAASIAFPGDDKKTAALQEQLRTMLKMGDISGVQLKLEEMKNGAYVRGMIARGRELDLLDQQKQAISEEISRLKELNKEKGFNQSRNDRLTQKEKDLADIQNRKVERTVEMAGDNQADRQARLASDVQHLAMMEREKLLAESIRSIYADMGAQTATGRFDADKAAIEATLQQKKALIDALNNDPATKTKAEAERAKEIADVEKEVQATTEAYKKQRDIANAMPANERNMDAVREREETKQFNPETKIGAVTQFMGAVPGEIVDFIEDKTGTNAGDKQARAKINALKSVEDLHKAVMESERKLAQLRSAPVSTTEVGAKREEEIKKLDEEKRALEAKARAMDDTARKLQEQRDRNQVTRSFGKNEGSAFAVGSTEAEQLAATEKGLDGIIEKRMVAAKIAGDEVAANEQAVLAMQAINDQQDLLTRKAEMQVKLEVDKKNAIIEQNREYQRSLLMAGPGDLLRKLAVQQIGGQGGRNLNLGSFKALDEKAQADATSMFPMFNPKIQEINRGINALGPQRGLAEQQGAFAGLREAFRDMIKFVTVQIQNPKPDVIAEPARVAAENIGKLGIAAAAATTALEGIIKLLPGFGGGDKGNAAVGMPLHPVMFTV